MQGWGTWLSGKEEPSPFLANPQYVPESFLIFIIMSAVLIVKGFEMFLKGGEEHGNTTTKQIN